MISDINKEKKSIKVKNANIKTLSKVKIKKNKSENKLISENSFLNKQLKTQQIPDYIKVNSIKGGRIKSFSYFSHPGINIDGFQKINQDSYLILPNLKNFKDFNVFGIMDGHGTDGHFIANFVSKYFVKFFKKNFNQERNDYLDYINYLLQENNFFLIKNIFVKAEKELKNFDNKNIDSNFSGTTCVIVIQIGNRIICANVGDSRAIMVKSYDRIISLSHEHKPELLEESERILKTGGEICQMEEFGKRIGPYRIWKKGEKYPGIDISRSIGDTIASKLGVISTPEIIEKYIDNETKFIVIMSKGVSEFLSNKNIMDIVMTFYEKKDAKGACQSIVHYAKQVWSEEETIIDDITVIVIFF